MPGIRFDALARHTFLGVQAAEDALSALLADGSVRTDAKGGFELTPAGRVVWSYTPTGFWSLDRPSLAVRWPNGLIAVTDDWHHRVVVINPATKKVVWSYGHLNQPGTRLPEQARRARPAPGRAVKSKIP